MSTEVVVQFKAVGDEDVIKAQQTVAKQIAQLKALAKTPIETKFVSGSVTSGMDKFSQQVMAAREQVKKLNEEMNKTSKINQQAQKPVVQLSPSQVAMKQIRQMQATAALPIESSMFRTAAGSNFSKIAADTQKARTELELYNKEMGKTGQTANQTAGSLGFVSRLLVAMAIRKVAHDVVELADVYTSMQNKLKVVSKDQASLNTATEDMIRIANTARAPLDAVTQVYTRTARAVSQMGKSQLETTRFTETLVKATQIGGATATESRGAMIQLSQAMASGVLRGEELNSVMEQMPIVAEFIQKKLKITQGELRALAKEGKITSEVVFQSVLEAMPSINQEFSKLTPTIAQSFDVLKNKFLVAVGESSELTRKLSQGVMYLADNFDVASRAAIALGAAMTALAANNIWKIISAFVVANPWVALAAAITAAAVALVAFRDKIMITADGFATLGDAMKAAMQEMGKSITDAFDRIGDAWTGLREMLGMPEAPPALQGMNDALVGITEETQNTIMKMATLADIVTDVFAPFKYITAKVTGENYGTMFRDKARRMIDSMNQSTQQREIKAILQRDKEMRKQLDEARYDAEVLEGLHPSRSSTSVKDKKPRSEAGMTIEEMRQELTREMEKQRIASALESLSPIEARTMQGMIDAQEKLKKSSQKNMSFDEYRELRALIEQKETLEEIDKLRKSIKEQAIESAKAEWEQFAKDYEARMKFEKEQADMVRQYQEERADREVARYEEGKAIARQLNPNLVKQEEIDRLEKFKETFKHLPEYVRAAEDAIKKLEMSMTPMGRAFLTLSDEMNALFGENGALVRGFADVTARAIVMNMSLRETKRAFKDLLNSITQQALSNVLKMPLNILMGSITQGISGNSGLAFTTPPFASGGYTGNVSTNAIAGHVHGQEYVVNAAATRKYRPMLEAINSGKSVTLDKSAAGSAPVNVNIHNNAPGVDVQQVTSPSTGEIEIMINKAIRDRAGNIIAKQITDSNSIVSRALDRNIEAGRKRL